VQSVRLYLSKFAGWAEVVGVIATLVLLPVDRLPYIHYTPFGLGFISLILLLFAVSWRLIPLLQARDHTKLKKISLVGMLLALPVVGYGLSSSYALDHAYALSATKTLLAVCLRAFCFFVLVSENPALWKLIRKTIYITTAVVISYGFLQFLLDVFGVSPKFTDLRNCCTSNSTYVFPRVYSTALEPLYFDHYLMIPIWLLTFDFLRSKTLRNDKRLIILFLGTATLFILTVARSASIALIISGIVFLAGLHWFAREKDFIKSMTKRWVAAISIALLLVLISGFAAIFIPKNARYNDSGFGSLRLFGGHAVDVNDGSARTRYDLWPKSIGYIKERPLEGVGANNSRIKLDWEDYKKGVQPNRLQPFNNDVIALLVDLGMLAFVFFGPLFAVLILALVRIYKSNWKGASAPFALILTSMLLQGNFFQSLLLTRLWVVIGLLLVLFIAPGNIRKYENTN
jgi:O-antigen ligase